MSRWLAVVAVVIGMLAVQQPVLAATLPATPVDPEACDDGTIVSDPTNNTELVADCEVLAGLKETLEGTSNVHRRLDWSDSKSISDWEGITVGDSPKTGGGTAKRVTVIMLDSGGGTPTAPQPLNGRLPAAIADLTGLVTINLDQNRLSGPIPPELGDLPNLVTLDLSYNRFRGPFNTDDPRNPYYEPGIPSELGNLKETLQHLDLGGNNLTGDIPSEIWELTELRSLRLHGNKNIDGGTGLTGTIPAEIKNLTKLKTLHLHGNAFSGPIPPEIAQLSELESLALYLNGFTGTIPSGLGSLPLETLDLRDNQLTGSIPSELVKLLPELRTLNLGGNSWTGCVPRRLLEVNANDLQFIMDYYGVPLCGPDGNTNPPPSISSATVIGATLTLTYSEPLDSGSQPAIGDYEVTVNDSTSEHAVDAVLVGGSTVTLTLDPAVVASDTVLVSYRPPDTSPVQDSAGADAGALTNHPVTNNTTPAPPVFRSGVVDGGTLTLTYSEDLDENSELATTTYTVTADSTTHTVSDVAISGTTVTLTLTTPVQGGQTVRLSYAPPSTDPLQDLDGEDAAQLTNVTIANNTGVPPMLDSAEVDGDTLTLTYNEPLDGNSEPATSAYTVTVDSVDRGVTGVVVSGSTVTLTLVSAVVGGEAVLVSYDAPQTDPVQDTSGTAAADLTEHLVKNITNNSPAFSTLALTVAEHTQAVGTVVAEDPDTQDSVTYILKAADPEDDGRMFAITSVGVLSFKAATGADYEHSGAVDGSNVYRVTVMAMSGSGTRERMTIEQITVTITNAEDDGRLLFSSEQPQVGTALLATVDDPDGSVFRHHLVVGDLLGPEQLDDPDASDHAEHPPRPRTRRSRPMRPMGASTSASPPTTTTR